MSSRTRQLERLPQSLRANSSLHHLRFSRVSVRLTPQALSLRLKAEQERVARAERGARLGLETYVSRRRDRFDAVTARLASAMRTNLQSRQIAINRQRERINTLYAHLSGFASGIRVGARVHQGQPIGFVGATGVISTSKKSPVRCGICS